MCNSGLITNPPPVEDITDLRPTRRALGLTLAEVAGTLNCGIAKISRIERGIIHDSRFLHEYRDWLASHQPMKLAA